MQLGCLFKFAGSCLTRPLSVSKSETSSTSKPFDGWTGSFIIHIFSVLFYVFGSQLLGRLKVWKWRVWFISFGLFGVLIMCVDHPARLTFNYFSSWCFCCYDFISLLSTLLILAWELILILLPQVCWLLYTRNISGF